MGNALKQQQQQHGLKYSGLKTVGGQNELEENWRYGLKPAYNRHKFISLSHG